MFLKKGQLQKKRGKKHLFCTKTLFSISREEFDYQSLERDSPCGRFILCKLPNSRCLVLFKSMKLLQVINDT